MHICPVSDKQESKRNTRIPKNYYKLTTYYHNSTTVDLKKWWQKLTVSLVISQCLKIVSSTCCKSSTFMIQLLFITANSISLLATWEGSVWALQGPAEEVAAVQAQCLFLYSSNPVHHTGN